MSLCFQEKKKKLKGEVNVFLPLPLSLFQMPSKTKKFKDFHVWGRFRQKEEREI